MEGCPRDRAGPVEGVLHSTCHGQDWSQIQKDFVGEWALSQDDSLSWFCKQKAYESKGKEAWTDR